MFGICLSDNTTRHFLTLHWHLAACDAEQNTAESGFLRLCHRWSHYLWLPTSLLSCGNMSICKNLIQLHNWLLLRHIYTVIGPLRLLHAHNTRLFPWQMFPQCVCVCVVFVLLVFFFTRKNLLHLKAQFVNSATRGLTIRTLKQKTLFDDVIKQRGIMGFIYFIVKLPPCHMEISEWLRQKCSQTR